MEPVRKLLHCFSEADRETWERVRKAAKKTPISQIIQNIQPQPYCQKWIVLSDVHRPFHNRILWDKVLRLIRDMPHLHGIVLAGDYLDLYTLGSYNSDSLGLLRDIDLDFEYRDGLDGIIELERAMPNIKEKLFLFGNHEDRYFRTLNSKDNAKFGAALKNPVVALQLRERGWKVKTNWKEDYFTLGDHLDVMHGIFCGQNVAKKHLNCTKHSVMFGHTHGVEAVHLGNKASLNIGGLFDMNSKAFGYASRFTRDKWANGFAIVNIDQHGSFFVEQVNVWNDCFLANGKFY